MLSSKTKIEFTQNRELSWLRFNERVLEEANDESVSLFERLRFLSIFISNLDEFFMIRVGSLYDLSLLPEPHIDNKSGLTAEEQLKAVYKSMPALYEKRDSTYEALEYKLREFNICNVTEKDLTPKERKFVKNYFQSYVMPILSPQVVDSHHPFPHLENKALYIGVMLKSNDDRLFGIIPVPKSMPRMVMLPGSGIRYILLEELVYEYAESVFDMYSTDGKTILTVTRNADINADDEAYELEEDFRLRMKKVLKKRARLAAVRLEFQHKPDSAISSYLFSKLDLHKEQSFLSSVPLDMAYLGTLADKIPNESKRILMYPSFEPQQPKAILHSDSMLKQAFKKDVLLYYPYESMEPFLRMIKEAVSDQAVISIKISLYRIDKQSKLAELLISAAENGKDVTVLMELRARFDEQNNIEWAERLEEAGCRVIYGIENFKAHAKVCLITLRDRNKLHYITQIGTGNYNEKTAKAYSDFCLITADSEIGKDAAAFFKNMSISNLNGSYNRLLVAPSSFKKYIVAMIDGEIDKQKSGRPSGILFKLNSLTDRDILDKLAEASCAGVQIRLIIRGICCILPGIKGHTENISVISIVGRYLEHVRAYCFGGSGDMSIYIASADLMTRNTERRVEVACPILDADLKTRIINILEAQLKDNVKARRLLPDGSYERVQAEEDEPFSCQEYFMGKAIEGAKLKPSSKNSITGFFAGLKNKLIKI